MRITAAQLDPTVGYIEGNLRLATRTIEQAASQGADLVVFPELFLTGYPPKDLLERREFIERARSGVEKLQELSREHASLGILLGAPMANDLEEGKGLFNAALLIRDGALLFEQAKSLLPTYDVFDEARYFDPAHSIEPCSYGNEHLGITICEDAWNDPDFYSHRLYSIDPVDILAGKGATIIINISASPFTMGKEKVRFELIGSQARRHKLPILVVNQVGGNDDLVFDGRSLFLDEQGRALEVFPSFEERVATIDTKRTSRPIRYDFEEDVESVYRALVLGTRDYVRKCGFDSVVLGLSGGIDSAVTCAVACEAIGPKKVLALSMPSPYTSPESLEDATKVASNLGVRLETIPIDRLMDAYEKELAAHFAGRQRDVTEENIQARIRGNILMAFANKFGYLPLSTGNKSELAVGYCTLYGDMSGGLSVISDVPKSLVYDLASYVNRGEEVIPKRVFTRPPSAELKPGQKDEDVLPPYELLDSILELHVDRGLSSKEIAGKGFDEGVVRWVVEAVRKNEYKRKQAPPGLKVTTKSFGSGRRMPIAAKYDL